MSVRKKASVSAKRKASASKSVKSSRVSKNPWYRKYMGWIIGGGVLYVLCLILGNLIFFKDNVSADFQVRLVTKITAMDSGSGPFAPGGVALLGNDQIAVSDTTTKRILLFGKDGKFLRFVGKEISKEDRDLIHQNKKSLPEEAFLGIGGLCVVDGENIYAIDDQSNIVRGFGPTFKPLEPVDFRLLGCYGPRSVNYDGKNFLISDTGSHRVLGLNRDGQIQLTLGGKHGDANGEMNNPVDVVYDGKGRYIVADMDNSRFQIFNDKGKFEKSVKLGARPSAVAVFPDGKILVSSPEGNFVKVFKENGKFIGSLKEVKGDASFTAIINARVGPDGLIYLTSNDTVYVVKAEPKS